MQHELDSDGIGVSALVSRRATIAATVRQLGAIALRASPILLFAGVSAFWLLIGYVGMFASDALVYRAGAKQLGGGNPWTAAHQGWLFSAPPLEAIAFVPATLIPEAIFAVLWVFVSSVAGIVIVRRLALPAWWIAYPPLVLGALVGNPSVVGMAAMLLGWPVIGLILRPQLLFVAGWRPFLIFAVLSVLAIGLRPDFLQIVPTLAANYSVQSGPPVNFWGSPWMIPSLMALGLLWTVDRRAASWLVMPAVGPAMGWYGYAMVMPVRSLFLGVACAVPVPGLGALAITLFAFGRWAQVRTALGSRLGAALAARLTSVRTSVFPRNPQNDLPAASRPPNDVAVQPTQPLGIGS